MNARFRSPLVIWSAQVVCLAVAVYLVGRLGRVSILSSGEVVSFWSCAGIALAGVLFFGNRIWPGAWLGSFLLEMTVPLKGPGANTGDVPLLFAAIVATGSVLHAVAAGWVIKRVLDKVPALDSVAEAFAVLGLGAVITAPLGATARSLSLLAVNQGMPSWETWSAGWGPELTGVFVFAPVALTVLSARLRPPDWPRPIRVIEAAVLFIVIPAIISQVSTDRDSDYGIMLVTGSALWATLRFGKVGTGLNLLLLALMLASNMRSGTPLVGSIHVSASTATNDAQLLQGAFSVTFWSLAALLNERERVAKELRENEARFRQFSEGMPHVIWMMTPDKYHFLYVNGAFEQIYGLSRQDLYDSSGLWLACVHPEDRHRVAEARWGRGGTSEYCEEYRVVHGDGTVRWVRETAVPLRNEQHEIVMFGGTAEDITQSRQVAEELARNQLEVLHVSRLSSVGEMVATLSHEVAQPMSAIGTFATVCTGLLESKSETANWFDNVKKCIESIATENQRCRAILRRLRDYTRKAPRQRAPCDVNAVLREAVDLIVNELRRHDVKIRQDLAPRTALVAGDRIQLQQVIINLLTNARDAMLDVEVPRRVVLLRSRMEGDFVAVEVSDAGSGLPAGQNGEIFEPFFTTKPEGMGIGLSICKTIVEEHGGEIVAFTNETGGATFRIRLPTGEKAPEEFELRLSGNSSAP